MDEAREFKADKVCVICGSDKELVVDHDHKTGVIRGVLCGKCNRGIGLLDDSPERLRRAAVYLEEVNARSVLR